MFYGQKRNYGAFSNLRHYTNVRNPLKDDEKVIHPENYNETNIERYKYQVIEQQTKIQNLENRILSMNNEIELKAHQLLHSTENERQIVALKDEITSMQLERNALQQKFGNEISSMKISFEQRAREYEEVQRRQILMHNNEMTILKNEADKIKYELQKAKETDSNEIKLLENKIKAITYDNETMVQTNKRSLDEVNVLKKNIEDLELKNRNLQISKDEAVRSLQSNIMRLEDRIRDITTNLQGKNSMEIETSMQEVISLNRQLEHLREDLKREKDVNEELKRQRQLENNKFIQSENAIRNLQNDVEKRKQDILVAQDNLNRVKNELQSAKNEIGRKDDAITRLERANNENEQKLRTYEFEITSIRNEKNNLERNLAGASYSTSSEMAQMQNQINEYGLKIQSLEFEKNQLQQSYVNENRSVQNLQNIKMNLENEIIQLKNMDKEKSNKYDLALKNKLADFTNQNTSANTMIIELQQQLEMIKKDRDDAKIKILDLQRTIAVKDQDIQRYVSQINDQSIQLDTLKSEIAMYKSKIADVEMLITEHMGKIVQSLISLKDLNPGYGNFEFTNLISELQSEISRNNIKGVLTIIPNVVNKLRNLLQDSENKNIIVSQENSSTYENLKRQISQLTEQIRHSESIKNEFNARDSNFAQQVEAFRASETQMKETIYNYGKQIQNLEAQVYKLTSDNQELLQQLYQAKQGVGENTENMAFISKEFERTKKENEILKQNIINIANNNGIQGLIKNKEKFYKPSLKFLMLLFGKSRIRVEDFSQEDLNVEVISPTMTYWVTLLNQMTNVKWGIFQIHESHSRRFFIKTIDNNVILANTGLSELYSQIEKVRMSAAKHRGFSSINMLFWEIQKRILQSIVSGVESHMNKYEPAAVFDLDWITNFSNIYIRSTKNINNTSDVCIDIPSEFYTYLKVTSWHAVPDFSIVGNKRLERMGKILPPQQVEFNMLLVAYELIRDAHALEKILSTAGVGLRKKNEYYDEINYIYANDVNNQRALNLCMTIKFHLFHYFSRFSFSGEIDFAPVKDLLNATIEKHHTNYTDQSLAEKNRQNIKKRLRMRKTRYVRKDLDAVDQEQQDFAKFNLPTDSITGEQDNIENIPEVKEIPLESVKNFIVKIDSTAGCVLGEDNDVFQGLEDNSIKPEPKGFENIEDILLHKRDRSIHNTLIKNALNKDQIVWKTKEFTKSEAEANLLTILNALKAPVVELGITVGNFGNSQIFEQQLVEGVGVRRI